MKTKNIVALILVLLGTNLFTYATTRHWTTKHVLASARERAYAVLRKEGLYEFIYPPEKIPTEKPARASILLAINNAGGLYYWWNEGSIYWGLGALLTISGVLVTRLSSRKSVAS